MTTLKKGAAKGAIKKSNNLTAKKKVGAKVAKPKKKVITPEEKDKIKYSKSIVRIFELAGFTHVKSDGIDINFKDRAGEIDNLFFYENIIVVCEETASNENNVWSHLNKKNIIFSLIEQNQHDFVEYVFETYKDAKSLHTYAVQHYKVILLYCSKYDVEAQYKLLVCKAIKYLGVKEFWYFKELTDSIKKSARFELFDFFGLAFNDIGTNAVRPNASASQSYRASVLPEAANGFKQGYKVVSFYIDPETLIERAFVLRRSGWKNAGVLYQRPLIAKKISKMREHLQGNKGVFVNNIIATLPETTVFTPASGDSSQIIVPSTLIQTAPVTVALPNEFNSICIIDGQHRLFSYHEGNDSFESSIKRLRVAQNLLVTAIRYPDGTTNEEKIIFEAKLFIDINNNQTNAKSELIQEIKTIIDQFSPDAIARQVLQEMNGFGALNGKIAVHPHETEKIKPTTIVSYGLKPATKLSGDDSLFAMWSKPNKSDLLARKDFVLLNEYRKFAAGEINSIISAFRQVFDSEMGKNQWETAGGVVTKVMVINGLISCLRKLIEAGKAGDRNYYVTQFEGIGEFDFSTYKGSLWNSLGNELYTSHFS